jgi:hypothetical protein
MLPLQGGVGCTAKSVSNHMTAAPRVKQNFTITTTNKIDAARNRFLTVEKEAELI